MVKGCHVVFLFGAVCQSQEGKSYVIYASLRARKAQGLTRRTQSGLTVSLYLKIEKESFNSTPCLLEAMLLVFCKSTHDSNTNACSWTLVVEICCIQMEEWI